MTADPAAVWGLEAPAFPRVVRPFGVRAEDGLTWYPERGMGYYPVRTNGVYDQAYFDKYRRYAETAIGQRLTEARLELVRRYAPTAVLLDVGIGSGAFVEARNAQQSGITFGYDVNPCGVAWLLERDLYRDPLAGPVQAMTFWDSLEHIHDPEQILANAGTAFITIPIFTGPDHVLRSKHFRRDEHIWYFTRAGLIGWMAALGFACLEHNTMESLRGREDVDTFVFTRSS